MKHRGADEAYEFAEARRVSLYFTSDCLSVGNSTLYDAALRPARVALVTDAGLPARMPHSALCYFREHGCAVEHITVPGGESAKSVATCIDIASRLADYGLLRRSEPVIIMGGGAVLDVAGLACSLYRRGVSYVRVPTTLLGLVDAGVGAKTGVNVLDRKNLFGTFFPPIAAVLDHSFVSTLGQGEIRSGLGEVFKYAIAADRALFDVLEDLVAKNRPLDGSLRLREVAERSARGHMRLLADDLYETRLERPLDLGHTVGPHLEMTTPGLSHGEAVALDVALSAAISCSLGVLSEVDLCRVLALASRLGVRLESAEVSLSLVHTALNERKIHRDGQLRLPIPVEIGSVAFIDWVDDGVIRAALEAFQLFDGHGRDSQRCDPP